MKKMSKLSLQTRLVQLGNKSEQITGAVSTPIHLSTAYRHEGLHQSTGFDYSRTKNPTRTILEEGIADLECGDKGFACSSGMAAITELQANAISSHYKSAMPSSKTVVVGFFVLDR